MGGEDEMRGVLYPSAGLSTRVSMYRRKRNHDHQSFNHDNSIHCIILNAD